MLKSLAVAAALLSITAIAAPTRQEQYFFDSIPASEELQWYPCNETFYCARLSVPLNPRDPLNGLRSEIPLIKMPAMESCDYKGIVLTNPGGPGGLGIGFILTTGEQIQNFTGGGYDVIGFDPRGMGYSVPNGAFENPLTTRPINPKRVNATYIPSEDAGVRKRQTAEDNFGIKVPPRSPSWLPSVYNASEQFNVLLRAVSAENQALPYMGTPNVAFDMLEIAKADARSKGAKCTDDVLVNYYGVSYGSVLGQTFASIYPQHVGRFVIDSVVDLDTWYNGRTDNLDTVFAHSDENFHEFFQACFDAGPELCTFYTGTSANDILARFNNIFSHFDPTKAEVEGWENLTEITVGTETMKTILQEVGYNAITTFPLLSETLVHVERLIKANNVTIESMGEVGAAWTAPEDASTPDRAEYLFEALCSDTYNRALSGSHKPIDQSIVDAFKNASVTTGERILLVYAICSGLDIKPNWLFNYPIGVKTKNPILFIGLRVDHITPIENAEKAAKLYEGSELLYVDVVGHGITDKDNWCAFDKTRAYFENGTLPGSDNRCGREAIPFVSIPSSVVASEEVPAPAKRDLHSRKLPASEWRPRPLAL